MPAKNDMTNFVLKNETAQPTNFIYLNATKFLKIICVNLKLPKIFRHRKS